VRFKRTDLRHKDIRKGTPAFIDGQWYCYTGFVVAEDETHIKDGEIVDADGKIFRKIGPHYRKAFLLQSIRSATREMIEQ